MGPAVLVISKYILHHVDTPPPQLPGTLQTEDPVLVSRDEQSWEVPAHQHLLALVQPVVPGLLAGAVSPNSLHGVHAVVVGDAVLCPDELWVRVGGEQGSVGGGAG